MGVRELISIVWTAINVGLVVDLAWFLVESRHDADRKSAGAALSLMATFAGSALAQVYAIVITKYVGTTGDASPYLPIAVLAVVAALVGGACAVWIFRPRRARGYLWVVAVLAAAVGTAVVRLAFEWAPT